MGNRLEGPYHETMAANLGCQFDTSSHEGLLSEDYLRI